MFTRRFRMPAIAVIAALAFGALGTSAAEAKPVKPGGVPGVTGVATWHSGTTYDVAATWGSVTGATSYRAAIIKGSTALTAIFPLRERDGSNSILLKERRDGRGAILISGANSPASLSQVSMPRANALPG